MAEILKPPPKEDQKPMIAECPCGSIEFMIYIGGPPRCANPDCLRIVQGIVCKEE